MLNRFAFVMNRKKGGKILHNFFRLLFISSIVNFLVEFKPHLPLMVDTLLRMVLAMIAMDFGAV